MEISQCPVVRPTEAEFYDFWGFIQRIDQTYSKDYGMVKVIMVKGRSSPLPVGNPRPKTTRRG